MNERIRELAEQARQYAFGQVEKSQDATLWNTKYYNEMFEAKFSELIVRECRQVLVDNTPVENLVEDWDKGYDRAMNDCVHHIYEHFGVEE